MKLSLRVMLGSLVLISVMATGCSKSSSSGNGGGPNPNKPADGPAGPEGATACETAWAHYVRANPKGMSTTYKIKSKPPMGQETERTETSTVTESNDTEVAWTRKIDNAASEHKYTKADFLKQCKPGTTTEKPKEEILEERDERIDVPAGTFAVHYKKSKMVIEQNAESETFMETWITLESPLLVKSIMTMKMTFQGQTMESRTVQVLTHLTR